MLLSNITNTREMVLAYSDYSSANAWRAAHLENSDCPPVSFLANGKKSDSFSWKKHVGTTAYVRDFPQDKPADRLVRHDIYTCEELRLEVDVEVTSYPCFPVVEYLPVIKNIGNAPSCVISNLYAIDADILSGINMTQLHHSNGDAFNNNMKKTSHLSEYAPFTDYLACVGGRTSETFSSRLGLPTIHALPNFNAEDEEHNRGVIAVLSWSANWKATFEVDFDGHLHLSAGQLHTNFSLLPGETLRTPLMVLLFYKGDWLMGQNIWRQWYLRHNVLREYGHHMRTNLLYCISSDTNGMLNTAEENLRDVKMSAALGVNSEIDYINQDAGWYDVSPEKSWIHVGNWVPDPVRYPNGIRPISDLARKNGMLYSLWLEPERFYKGSQTHQALGCEASLCPVQGEDGKLYNASSPEEIPDGAYLAPDYTNPKSIAYLAELFTGIFKKEGVDQYRQDMNHITFWQYYVGKDNSEAKRLGIPRDGVTEAGYVAGFHTFWRELLRLNPGLLIDSCAGGGRRNDLETVRMSFIHTRSDDYTSAENAQEQTYGMSLWYMLMGSALLRETDDYDRRSRLASSMGTLVYEGEWAAHFRRSTALWREYMESFFSNYYPLTPYVEDDQTVLAMQFDELDLGHGIIPVYFRSAGSLKVLPKGLCAGASYRVWSEDAPENARIMTAEEFSTEGVTFTAKEKQAFMLKYERI